MKLRIEKLVHGGAGLARVEGRVVFVPGGAPGDVVEAELQPGRHARARVLRVLEPGPSRVAAPCPIVDRCGGCPLQHVSAPVQAETKRALVEDALVRIGGFPAGSLELADIVPSPSPFRYRRRARLHRGPRGSWGFASGRKVTPALECLLFEPALQRLADAVRGADLPGVTDLGLDVSDLGEGSIDLVAERPGPALFKRAGSLLGPSIRGATIGARIVGDPVIADAPVDGARFRTRADLFAQANRAAVPLLVGEVLAALDGAGHVLELFCGSGTLTLPLLRRASVLAVEGSAASLSLLRKSAAEAGLDAKLRLVAGDAAQVARGLDAQFDAVLLDPPRTGAAEAIAPIAALRPRRIVYVSCDAPTFARDAKALAAAGYRLLRVVPLDMFPQTAHLELVAAFGKSMRG